MRDAICRIPTARGSEPRGHPPVRRRRGRWPAPSWRGQPHHEARAGYRGLAVGADGPWTILGPDAAAMGFDDLLRNRQAQAGVLAKALVRAVGVKAFEDFLQRVLADARAVVIDDDLDFGAHAAADDADLAAGIGERLRVDQQVGDHLPQPRIVSR